MPITKRYSQDKKLCQVEFILPYEISKNFSEICVVGDFNGWDPHHDKLAHSSIDGNACIKITLETGIEYCFKYLCDNEVWLNEPDADKQVKTFFGDSYNSVLVI